MVIVILCVTWIVLIIWQIFLTLRKTKSEIQLEKKLADITGIVESVRDREAWLESKYYDFWEAATMRIIAKIPDLCQTCSRLNNCTKMQNKKGDPCAFWHISSKAVFRVILDKIFKEETRGGSFGNDI